MSMIRISPDLSARVIGRISVRPVYKAAPGEGPSQVAGWSVIAAGPDMDPTRVHFALGAKGNWRIASVFRTQDDARYALTVFENRVTEARNHDMHHLVEMEEKGSLTRGLTLLYEGAFPPDKAARALLEDWAKRDVG